jgi:hypothetical protein
MVLYIRVPLVTVLGKGFDDDGGDGGDGDGDGDGVSVENFFCPSVK